MKSKLLIAPLLLALAGAGCRSATSPAVQPAPAQPGAPVPSNPAPEPQATTTLSNDDVLAIKQYTDQGLGFTLTYPAEWNLDTSSGDIKFTNLGPDGDDFITIKRVMDVSATDTDSKFGDTKVRFDEKTSQWMVTRPDENEEEVEAPSQPDLLTDTGLPAFSGTGRWATYIVALGHAKFLIVNVSGSGWTDGLQSFVKTISLTHAPASPADINKNIMDLLDSEKAPED
ncbi:MAG TPA: hypothetical protein VMU11_01530 [Verrucomicrobiae bacterium]|nr:hypothetical protein [Verrucomicrobiae bacterium]